MIVAAALGTFILERVSAKDLSSRDWMLATAVGATVVALLSALPTIGWMFNLVCIAIGFGTPSADVCALSEIEHAPRSLRRCGWY
ncbi:MAG: hypothetical protein HND48_08275 [Chloroflexi bacterium]|nr:hypothetical protein [Chloroflexota bacterium]